MKRETNSKHLSDLANLDDIATENTCFRKILYTGSFGQLVMMSIPPHGQTNEHRTLHADVFLSVLKGHGTLIFDSQPRTVRKGRMLVVPAGTNYNVKNSGPDDLKLFAIYTPPEYPEGSVCQTHKEAEAADWKALERAWEQ
jgi:mannose-6-phosphate isomerase-like protein (cupin superfamily)